MHARACRERGALHLHCPPRPPPFPAALLSPRHPPKGWGAPVQAAARTRRAAGRRWPRRRPPLMRRRQRSAGAGGSHGGGACGRRRCVRPVERGVEVHREGWTRCIVSRRNTQQSSSLCSQYVLRSSITLVDSTESSMVVCGRLRSWGVCSTTVHARPCSLPSPTLHCGTPTRQTHSVAAYQTHAVVAAQTLTPPPHPHRQRVVGSGSGDGGGGSPRGTHPAPARRCRARASRPPVPRFAPLAAGRRGSRVSRARPPPRPSPTTARSRPRA